jgi:hypothetical protein
MGSSIAQHVTVISNDLAQVERDMQNLANKQGMPITANFNGKYICKIPAPVSTDGGAYGVDELRNIFGMR